MINWVVKPLLKNSTQSDNDPETVSCSFWGQHFVYREITLRWKKKIAGVKIKCQTTFLTALSTPK